ncbi:MAG: carbohydrate kinase family protein, partial [Clostridia bacterium]|nr:carbohydrate kinase family protein [Clostridia bacterium]
VLNARGDSLVSRADSIVVEIDMDAPILKRVFALAQQYGKDVYGVVSNMAIAMERRDLLQQTSCIVCNKQEAGMLFSEDYSEASAEEISALLPDRLARANIPRMVVTLGPDGAVYAEQGKGSGICTTPNVDPVDTTGCGDAFFSGVAIGLTYGKTLPEACEIGTRLAISVILTKESVCPRFRPEEFGLSPVQEE